MFSWFVKHAPIRKKLNIAFGLLIGLLATTIVLFGWQLGRIEQAYSAGDHDGLRQLLGSSVTLMWVCGLGAISVGLCIAVALRRAIVKPYVTTVLRMEALAAGDLASPVAFTDYTDCVGRMTKAMRVFKDAATERNRLQAEAAEQGVELDRKLCDAETAFRRSGADQAALLETLAKALKALAQGDLTARVATDVAPDYVRICNDFNQALAGLEETMMVVSRNSDGIRVASGEISQAADSLSRRTEQQAASLEETAAALDEITATVRRTAEGAVHARQTVANAKTDAEHSSQVVQDAIAAMGEIDRSAGQISQIIGVIDEIAFQTNLLALNAGVEAARAGEAGKGFAVVAQEVRALAQRAAEAAKEIKALISDSTSHVSTGVSLVGDTGTVLARIVAHVAEINTVVSEIAASAHEQSSGLAQINTAVNQMDQATQQNAAMVEQSTAASHALNEQATELALLIERFKTVSPATAPRRAASATVVQMRGARPAAPRPASGGAQPRQAVGDWTEF